VSRVWLDSGATLVAVMRKHLFRLYDWFSMCKDLLDNLGFALRYIQTLPAFGLTIGYVHSGTSTGAVTGSIVVAGCLIVLLIIATVVAVRRLPIHLTAGQVKSDVSWKRPGGLVGTADEGVSPTVGGWLTATLTGQVDGADDYRMTGLHAEFSKLVFGFIPVHVATFPCRGIEGTTGGVDWLLDGGGPAETARVSFSDDPMSFRRAREAETNESWRVRLIAEFGSPTRNIYIDVPDQVLVRPSNAASVNRF